MQQKLKKIIIKFRKNVGVVVRQAGQRSNFENFQKIQQRPKVEREDLWVVVSL
jgi:hypothetical protein